LRFLHIGEWFVAIGSGNHSSFDAALGKPLRMLFAWIRAVGVSGVGFVY
jgi:hypothetical protein